MFNDEELTCSKITCNKCGKTYTSKTIPIEYDDDGAFACCECGNTKAKEGFKVFPPIVVNSSTKDELNLKLP